MFTLLCTPEDMAFLANAIHGALLECLGSISSWEERFDSSYSTMLFPFLSTHAIPDATHPASSSWFRDVYTLADHGATPSYKDCHDRMHLYTQPEVPDPSQYPTTPAFHHAIRDAPGHARNNAQRCWYGRALEVLAFACAVFW